MVESVVREPAERAVQELARLAQAQGLTIATAESLTGGQLAVAISACEDSSEWYRGGIVAYQPAVKHGLLAAPPGPVVTAVTAAAMARSAVQLLEADYSVALTGVGGPARRKDSPRERCTWPPARPGVNLRSSTGSSTGTRSRSWNGPSWPPCTNSWTASLRGERPDRIPSVT